MLIQDSIHGPIPISKLDRYVISTRSFNRLHNVLQNSLAYFVYPSNKTSRFSHSLGVAHLSSLLLYYGFLNSNEDCLKSFLEDAKLFIEKKFSSEIDKLKKEFDEDRNIPSYISFDDLGLNIEIIYKFTRDDRAILNFIPGNIEDDYKSTYMFILQSLRIASLLHDIGHLPMSHLLEFVLESYYDKLRDNKNINYTEKKRLELLEKHMHTKFKIHENLSRELIQYIFTYEILEYLQIHPDRDNKKRYAYKKYSDLLTLNMYLSMVDAILFDWRNNSITESLHNIISSDFDADRMDYIMRDGITSGLLKSSGNIDRIVRLYTLVCNANSADISHEKKYYFLPSTRSLKDIEEMLVDRYNLYKYMYFHHKVTLLEYILEKILIKMLDNEDYTNGDEQISYIFEIIDMGNQGEKKINLKKMYNFFKIDDFWLMYIVRKKYIDWLERGVGDSGLGKHLAEFFTRGNEIYFKSLWKRDTDFYEFINKFIFSYKDEICELFSNIDFLDKEENYKIKRIIEGIKEGKKDPSENLIHDFLYIIYRIFEKSRRGMPWILNKIEKDINQHCENNNYIYICPYPLFIKVSVDNLKIFDRKKGIITINQISNIGKYLSTKHYLSPMFNAYSNVDNDEKAEKLISESLFKLLKSEINEISKLM